MKYKKFDKETAKRNAKKWGFDKIEIDLIQREIDIICYQFKDREEGKTKFELGILNPDYQKDLNYQKYKNLGIHKVIQFCVEKELDTKIDIWETMLLKGILCEDSQELRYLITSSVPKEEQISKYYKGFAEGLELRIRVDDFFLKKIAEMLKRYKIAKLFLGEVGDKNIENLIEKSVWDVQTSVYAKKKGMTNIEFLRQRLLGFRDDLSESKENNKK